MTNRPPVSTRQINAWSEMYGINPSLMRRLASANGNQYVHGEVLDKILSVNTAELSSFLLSLPTPDKPHGLGISVEFLAPNSLGYNALFAFSGHPIHHLGPKNEIATIYWDCNGKERYCGPKSASGERVLPTYIRTVGLGLVGYGKVISHIEQLSSRGFVYHMDVGYGADYRKDGQLTHNNINVTDSPLEFGCKLPCTRADGYFAISKDLRFWEDSQPIRSLAEKCNNRFFREGKVHDPAAERSIIGLISMLRMKAGQN